MISSTTKPTRTLPVKTALMLFCLTLALGSLTALAEDSRSALEKDHVALQSAIEKDTVPALLRFLLHSRTQTYADQAREHIDSISLTRGLCQAALYKEDIEQLIASLQDSAGSQGLKMIIVRGDEQAVTGNMTLLPLTFTGHGAYNSITKWLESLEQGREPLLLESFVLERVKEKPAELKFNLKAYVPIKFRDCDDLGKQTIKPPDMQKIFSAADLKLTVQMTTRETPPGIGLYKLSLVEGRGGLVFSARDDKAAERLLDKLKPLSPFIVSPKLKRKGFIEFDFRHDALRNMKRLAVADYFSTERGKMLKLTFFNYTPQEREVYSEWLISETGLEVIEVRDAELNDYAVQFTLHFHRKER